MIVVDTHVIIWNALRPEELSKISKRAISRANGQDGILFCTISLWEIAMLMQKGRISVGTSYLEFIRLVLESNNYILRGITPEIAELSSQLNSDIGKDPADRIITATAIVEKAQLVTSDKKLRKSEIISTIW